MQNYDNCSPILYKTILLTDFSIDVQNEIDMLASSGIIYRFLSYFKDTFKAY